MIKEMISRKVYPVAWPTRLTKAQHRGLKEVSEELGVSMSAVMRAGIEREVRIQRRKLREKAKGQ